ncbi:hypothetical protein BKA70DRAFT_1216197 [Coprinopsis sp. MPI-PUGE-AT-0042]|nr:hypothetical protein BKA70DRAFT_1216197 [Coprinopsis sp. MPI-PUGE-AT-0042]
MSTPASSPVPTQPSPTPPSPTSTASPTVPGAFGHGRPSRTGKARAAPVQPSRRYYPYNDEGTNRETLGAARLDPVLRTIPSVLLPAGVTPTSIPTQEANPSPPNPDTLSRSVRKIEQIVNPIDEAQAAHHIPNSNPDSVVHPVHAAESAATTNYAPLPDLAQTLRHRPAQRQAIDNTQSIGYSVPSAPLPLPSAQSPVNNDNQLQLPPVQQPTYPHQPLSIQQPQRPTFPYLPPGIQQPTNPYQRTPISGLDQQSHLQPQLFYPSTQYDPTRPPSSTFNFDFYPQPPNLHAPYPQYAGQNPLVTASERGSSRGSFIDPDQDMVDAFTDNASSRPSSTHSSAVSGTGTAHKRRRTAQGERSRPLPSNHSAPHPSSLANPGQAPTQTEATGDFDRIEHSLALLIQGVTDTNSLLRGAITSGLTERLPQSEPPALPNVTVLEGGSAATAPRHRPQANIVLENRVRAFFKRIIRAAPGDPVKFLTWKVTDGPCCDIDSFFLDVTAKPMAAWNKSAREVFVQGFLDSNDPILAIVEPTPKDIRRLWLSNFRRLRQKHFSLEDGQTYKRERRRRERRRWLYFRRLRAALNYEETARFARLVQLYGVDGMSTDESVHDEQDTGVPTYRVRAKKWRNRGATTIFRTLDAVHRNSRFQSHRVAGPGAQPHLRIGGPNQSSRRPVPKLPATLYCEDWLQNQTKFNRRAMEIQPPIDLDLSLDANIVELANRNNAQLGAVPSYV